MYPTEAGEEASWSSPSAFFQEPKPTLFLCVSATPADSGQSLKHCSPQTGFLRAVCPSRRRCAPPLPTLATWQGHPRATFLYSASQNLVERKGWGWGGDCSHPGRQHLTSFRSWHLHVGLELEEVKPLPPRTASHLPKGRACTPSLRCCCCC